MICWFAHVSCMAWHHNANIQDTMPISRTQRKFVTHGRVSITVLPIIILIETELYSMSSVLLSFNNRKLEYNHSFISLKQAYKVAYADDESFCRIQHTTVYHLRRRDMIHRIFLLMSWVEDSTRWITYVPTLILVRHHISQLVAQIHAPLSLLPFYDLISMTETIQVLYKLVS